MTSGENGLSRSTLIDTGKVKDYEPLSSLDPQFREGLRRNLKRLHEATGTVFFMVTHDFVDALALADRAAVIRNGKIEQTGATTDIFHRPETTFIADFVGMRNVFPAALENGLWRIQNSVVHGNDLPVDGNGAIALRPEDIHISPEHDFPEQLTVLKGKVRTITREGFTWLVAMECRDIEVVVRIDQRSLLSGVIEEGGAVYVGLDPADMHYIPGSSG